MGCSRKEKDGVMLGMAVGAQTQEQDCPCRSRARQVAVEAVVPHGPAVRIPGFHPGSPGSTPGVGNQLCFILCLFWGSPGQGRCWSAGAGPAKAAKVGRDGVWDGEGRLRDREKVRGEFNCCLGRSRWDGRWGQALPGAHSGRTRARVVPLNNFITK